MGATTIGMIAGILCTISFVPQVIKIFKTKQAKDISLGMFLLFSTGVFLWLIYGLMIGSLPVILTNAAIFVLSVVIVLMKLKYT